MLVYEKLATQISQLKLSGKFLNSARQGSGFFVTTSNVGSQQDPAHQLRAKSALQDAPKAPNLTRTRRAEPTFSLQIPPTEIELTVGQALLDLESNVNDLK